MQNNQIATNGPHSLCVKALLLFPRSGIDRGDEFIMELFLKLVFGLQHLSLLIADSLDTGLWGDIFGWIPYISLNISFNIGGDFDLFLLTGSYLVPICLFYWYHHLLQVRASFYNAKPIGHPGGPLDRSEFKEKFTSSISYFLQGLLAEVVLLAIGILILLFVSESAGTVIVTVASIFVGLFLYSKLRGYFLKSILKYEVDQAYLRAIKLVCQELVLVDTVLALWLPLVLNTWVEVALGSEELALQIIFGALGPVMIILYLYRGYKVIKRGRNEGRSYWRIGEKHAITAFPEVKGKHKKFLPLFLLVEKLPIVLFTRFIENQDNISTGSYVILVYSIIVASFLGIVCVEEEYILNEMELVFRMSNSAVLFLTIISTDYAQLSLGPASTVIDVSTIMISVATTVYLIRIIDLSFVYSALKAWYKEKKESLKLERMKRQFNSFEAASRFIYAKDKHKLSKEEWEALTYLQKLMSVCVPRTDGRKPPGFMLGRMLPYNSRKLETTGLRATCVNGMDDVTQRDYGKDLQLVPLNDSLDDFKVLVDSGAHQTMRDNELVAIGVIDRNLSKRHWKYFFQHASQLNKYRFEKLFLSKKTSKVFLRGLTNTSETIEELQLIEITNRHEVATAVVTLLPSFMNLVHFEFKGHAEALKSSVDNFWTLNLFPALQAMEKECKSLIDVNISSNGLPKQCLIELLEFVKATQWPEQLIVDNNVSEFLCWEVFNIVQIQNHKVKISQNELDLYVKHNEDNSLTISVGYLHGIQKRESPLIFIDNGEPSFYPRIFYTIGDHGLGLVKTLCHLFIDHTVTPEHHSFRQRIETPGPYGGVQVSYGDTKEIDVNGKNLFTQKPGQKLLMQVFKEGAKYTEDIFEVLDMLLKLGVNFESDFEEGKSIAQIMIETETNSEEMKDWLRQNGFVNSV